MDPEASVTADRLGDFDVPTLFVTGDLDVLMPPQAIEAAAAMVPGARVENLGDVGHSSYFEDAPRFNRVVGAFLAELGW